MSNRDSLVRAPGPEPEEAAEGVGGGVVAPGPRWARGGMACGALPRGTDCHLPGAAETKSVASEGVGAAFSCRSARARLFEGVVHTARTHRAAGLGLEKGAPASRGVPPLSLSPGAPRAALSASLGGWPSRCCPPEPPGSGLARACVRAVLRAPTLLHAAVPCFHAEHPVFGHVRPAPQRVDGVCLGP